MKKFLFLLFALLALSLTLASCGDGESSTQAAPHTHTYASDWSSNAAGHWHASTCGHEARDFAPHAFSTGICTECSYRDPDFVEICVLDGAGNPVEGILIYIYKGEEQVGFLFTRADGKTQKKLPPENYRIELATTNGSQIFWNESEATLTPEKRTATVTVSRGLSNTEPIAGVNIADNKTAYTISADHYRTQFSSEEYTYFVFRAEKTGIYRITIEADTTVELGYYGAPINVFANDITAEDDRVDRSTILIDVAQRHLASDTSEATPYVIGIKGKLNSGVGTLKIERVGDHVLDFEDIPWTEVGTMANPQLYAPEGGTPTLVDFDLTDPNLKIIYNKNDGYYHHMTKDGPVVLVKIDIASKYIDSVAKITETDWFRAVIYKEDGTIARKESYQSMMLRYVEASKVANGGVGVYPLDDNLITAIKNHGTNAGWWQDSENSATNIFGDDWSKINKDNAWMFLFCYAKEQ